MARRKYSKVFFGQPGDVEQTINEWFRYAGDLVVDNISTTCTMIDEAHTNLIVVLVYSV